MKSFLEEIAEELLKTPHGLSDFVCILPSKRAGVFLKNELLKKNNKTVFSPTIYSIQDFIQELSGIKLAQNTILLFEFYQVFTRAIAKDQKENFYSFSKWAVNALQDFNEIDSHLVPADKIFSHLSAIKELNHWSHKERKTDLQINYLAFWKQLNHYYNLYKTRLLDLKIGYQGLIYREAVANLEFYIQNNQDKKHVFIGFNALNNAESVIIQEFLETADASVFWDIDRFFLEDKEHAAGFFIRKYLKEWKYYQTHPLQTISDTFSSEKEIEIIGIPKNIGQAKYIGKLLKTIHQTNTNFSKTAVVLGNESLLTPVLNSIPAQIETINITSGYPLRLSTITSFFNLFLEMVSHQTGRGWYFRQVIDLMSHPISSALFTTNKINYASALISKINRENIVYLDSKLIKQLLPTHKTALNDVFFSDEDSSITDLIKRCNSLIFCVKELYKADKQDHILSLEYLYHMYEIFNQINVLDDTYQTIDSVKTFKNIYQEILRNETIDFQGEPLEGLQLMGMLESRNLDFETVIISGLNEGILPSGKKDSSFIPFDVKQYFNMPTYREKDAIYSYHFYRLLQRAKHIYLLYNTEADVLEGGEKSRFLLQLTINKLATHHIKEIVTSAAVNFQQASLQQIDKSEALIAELIKVAEKGFSPTSLSNYIRNPIDFYYQTVLGIQREEEVEETVAANTLGTIVHNTLEVLYKPFEGEYLTTEILEAMKADVEALVKEQFRKVYKGGDISRGKNLIIYKVAIQYVIQFITTEIQTLKEGNQIKILHIESNLKVQIPISSLRFPVYLKGKVDRIDQKNGVLRIIDYKTGKVTATNVEIIDWELLIKEYKYSKAFQVLLYAWMFSKDHPVEQLEAGILSFKNLKNGFLRFAKKEKPRGGNRNYNIDRSVLKDFQDVLEVLIIELFNVELPFTEKLIE